MFVFNRLKIKKVWMLCWIMFCTFFLDCWHDHTDYAIPFSIKNSRTEREWERGGGGDSLEKGKEERKRKEDGGKRYCWLIFRLFCPECFLTASHKIPRVLWELLSLKFQGWAQKFTWDIQYFWFYFIFCSVTYIYLVYTYSYM